MTKTASLADIRFKYVELTCIGKISTEFREISRIICISRLCDRAKEALRGGAVTVVFHFPGVASYLLLCPL